MGGDADYLINNSDISVLNNKPKSQKPETLWESFLDLLKFAILALIIVMPIRVFVAQPFIVNGRSMVPTFQNGQYLIINEITYRFHPPERGDVIVFKYPKDTKKYFIKRIIGLPGETIEITGNNVKVYNFANPKGFEVDQPYVKNESNNNMKVTLGSGEYFVMGDNRNESSDSRYWGSVPRNLIVGKALLRLLPISDASYLPGDFKDQKTEVVF